MIPLATAGARRKAATLGAVAAVALVAAGCGGGGGETAATDGPSIFADSGCANCHGFDAADAADANGRVGPDLDESTLDVDAVIEKVRSGGGGMPAFGDLTDGQLETLAEYLVAERGGG